jgi:hypothetical protein
MYIEINERWQVYAGRDRRHRRPWVRYARFGGTRELHLFGWSLTVTRASEPTHDGIEPWVDDDFWSVPWVDDEVKGGVGRELQSPKR